MNEDNTGDEPKLSKSLNITGSAKPVVPVYACLIYVRDIDGGRVAARVANFAGIEMEANTERDALSRISREFKAKLLEFSLGGKDIPILETPPEPDPTERVRSIPVHL